MLAQATKAIFRGEMDAFPLDDMGLLVALHGGADLRVNFGGSRGLDLADKATHIH